jgi:hypothetical protein
VTVTKLTPKQLLDRMRKLTADLLGYDLSNLTPAQSVRLDRAATLRLELDDIQSRQLAGMPIDMTKFVVASEALERMLGGDPEQPTQRYDFSGAREELAALLAQRADALERRAEREAASLEASKEKNSSETLFSPPKHQGVTPTVQNSPVETPAAVLMPGHEEPPTSNVHHSYVDAAVLEPSPLRAHSLNNTTSQPTPAPRQPPSEVMRSFFSSPPGGTGRVGWRRFDPPRNF